MIEEIILNTNAKMQKAIEALVGDLAVIRTGRASPALIENIKVEHYGSVFPLKELSAISVAESRLLVVQPWDRTALQSIEKAILKSDIGLTPRNDGTVIRLSIPQLTEERRKELVKTVRKRLENGKVDLRNRRREAVEELRKLQKKGEISEDEQKRSLDKVQKLTDAFIEEADKIAGEKEAELTEI